MSDGTTPIRVLIADDEIAAREKLAYFLSEIAEFSVTHSVSNGEAALQAIAEGNVDIAFLDILMPGKNGLETATEISQQTPIAIVFVTAFDEFAIQAFELNAMDYLLKPYDKSRLKKTLERAQHQVRGEASQKAMHILNASAPEKRHIFKTSDGFTSLAETNIEWIEASGNYIKVCAKNNAIIARQTLSSIQTQLPANRFVRIHRSHLVNISCVSEVAPLNKGDYKIILESGTQLRLSRGFKEAFFNIFCP